MSYTIFIDCFCSVIPCVFRCILHFTSRPLIGLFVKSDDKDDVSEHRTVKVNNFQSNLNKITEQTKVTKGHWTKNFLCHKVYKTYLIMVHLG